MKDITTKSDIETVVNKQYDLLIHDKETAKIFSHLKLDEHLPRIYNFWCFVLQIEPEKNRYTGGVFGPHTKLNLKVEHFDIWMGHLNTALLPFEGEKRNEWWDKATQQAILFKYKLGLEPFEMKVIKRDK